MLTLVGTQTEAQMDNSGFQFAGHMDKIEVYANNTPLKFESTDLNIKIIDTDYMDCYNHLMSWKNLIEKNNNIKMDYDLTDLNYVSLKKLVKHKYPRKMKKKLFGTKKAKNKLMKKVKQHAPIKLSDFKRAGYIFNYD